MSDDLFNETDIEEEFNPEVTIPEGQNAWDQLVGEGKKFKDQEALAKAKLESDAYIAYLKKKLHETQTDLSTRLSLEQFAEQLRPASKTPDETIDPPVDKPRTEELTPEKLQALVDAALAKKEQERAINTNRQQVIEALERQYGHDAKKVLSNKARELGMSLADLQSIADRSPKAFFNLTGISGTVEAAPAAPIVPTSSVNTLGQAPSQVRGHKWYEEKKRTDPKWYNSPEASVQQFKDMKALGLEKYYAS